MLLNLRNLVFRVIFSFAAVLIHHSLLAQLPQKFSYQAVIRDNSNALMANQSLGMRVSLLQGSVNGSAVYMESHNPVTNSAGLVSIEIGGGSIVSGSFSGINWQSGPFFIKTETDPSGGTNYSISTTSQLLSVPYSLHAGNGISRVSATGDTLFLGNGNHLIIPGISTANHIGGGQPEVIAHSCGADSIHNPALVYGSVTDHDGNSYRTITIGSQVWMAENLKSSHFQNGDVIPMVSEADTWMALSTGGACWYNNDSTANACPYGKLYNWYAAADPRNVCPAGWHLPSNLEWFELENFIDSTITNPNSGGWRGTDAGGKIKSRSHLWNIPNTGAINSSGLSALPAGFRDFNGVFNNLGFSVNFWSSTDFMNSDAILRNFSFVDATSGSSNSNKRWGLSVRCIKN